MFLTLAPCDCVTYYQARGLSGHTSPCGECALSHFRASLEDCCLLGWSFTILLLWTLAPHDYVIYCQAQGLSGHTSPHGECACFIPKDPTPLEVEEDYLLFSWLDSKWAHLFHCKEIFNSELELLTPLWQAILGIRCSAAFHAAQQWFTLLGNGACCSTMVHAARQLLTTTRQLISVVGP